MGRNRKIPMAFLAFGFVALCALATPNLAHAQASLTGTTQAIDGCNTGVVNNMQARAQKKSAVSQSVYSNMAKVDAAVYQCLTNIENAIKALDGMSGTTPTDVFKSIMWNIVLQVVQQACAIAMADIAEIKTFVLSQFNRLCVPLPKLNLGLYGHLNLPFATCNGVNLLNPQFTTPGAVQGPGRWDLWGILQKNNTSGGN